MMQVRGHCLHVSLKHVDNKGQVLLGVIARKAHDKAVNANEVRAAYLLRALYEEVTRTLLKYGNSGGPVEMKYFFELFGVSVYGCSARGSMYSRERVSEILRVSGDTYDRYFLEACQELRNENYQLPQDLSDLGLSLKSAA